MQTVSVVIPTLGRKEPLINTLNSLLGQTFKPLEIVVVDQNQNIDGELVKLTEANPIIKHIRTKPQGLIAAYNRCWQEARGDIVIYVDDDVITDNDFVQNHLEVYLRNPNVGCVAGQIREENKKLIALTPASRFSKHTAAVSAFFNSTLSGEVDFPQGANMSFLRKALEAIGGFSKSFIANAYFFEVDAGLRIKKAGYSVFYQPQASLLHLIAPTGGARLNNKLKHTYYFCRHGMILAWRHGYPWALPFRFILNLTHVAKKAAKLIG